MMSSNSNDDIRLSVPLLSHGKNCNGVSSYERLISVTQGIQIVKYQPFVLYNLVLFFLCLLYKTRSHLSLVLFRGFSVTMTFAGGRPCFFMGYGTFASLVCGRKVGLNCIHCALEGLEIEELTVCVAQAKSTDLTFRMQIKCKHV